MKCIKEYIINSRFSRVVIIADTTPASMSISAEDVAGMDSSRIIASGSVLVCLDTGKTYVCGENRVFAEADSSALNFFNMEV